MKKLFIIFALMSFGIAFSQQITKNNSAETEEIAEFPEGGYQNFRKLIIDNFREKKVIGKGKEFCELKFIIDRDGSITNVTANGTNESFNKEAIRAITKIKTKWIPAKINGELVRYRFRIPLNLDFN